MRKNEGRKDRRPPLVPGGQLYEKNIRLFLSRFYHSAFRRPIGERKTTKLKTFCQQLFFPFSESFSERSPASCAFWQKNHPFSRLCPLGFVEHGILFFIETHDIFYLTIIPFTSATDGNCGAPQGNRSDTAPLPTVWAVLFLSQGIGLSFFVFDPTPS